MKAVNTPMDDGDDDWRLDSVKPPCRDVKGLRDMTLKKIERSVLKGLEHRVRQRQAYGLQCL
jgi:hypothetical protein